MNLTPNFNLILPEATDPYEDFHTWYNQTLAIIDANLGGGGSKHTIIDENGQALPNRTYLEFTGGVQVTDDALNNKTVVNITGGGGGSSTLAGLSDVTLTSPTDGQVLEYDSVTQKWINANPSGNAHIYSTTEKIVGEWIDGKPIYEITFPVANLPNNGSMNVTTPADIDLLIDAKGVVYNENDPTSQRPLPFSAGGTNDIRVDMNYGTIRIVVFSNWTAYKGYLTIRYTKTTD